MPLDITQNIAVQWLAGSIACQTLVFLKLTAMVCCSLRPVVTGLDFQAAILHPLGPRLAGGKLLGVARGLRFLLALPQVEWLVWTQG